jgi:hypothetical protein
MTNRVIDINVVPMGRHRNGFRVFRIVRNVRIAHLIGV